MRTLRSQLPAGQCARAQGHAAAPASPRCPAGCRPLPSDHRTVTDLFATANPATPLAERLRPRTIDEVIGQRHLLARASRSRWRSPRANAFDDPLGSPGVGKTTLARLMADAFSADFIALSAVLAGVKDIATRSHAPRRRWPIRAAHDPLRGRGPPLQQGQQDAFLRTWSGTRHVHRGNDREPVLRGHSALLSRAAVYVLERWRTTSSASFSTARWRSARPASSSMRARERR